MTKNIKHGGPAFPVHPEAHNRSDAECSVLSGMTLRDYFAGQAITAVGHRMSVIDSDMLAGVCYRIADAMLKARQQ